MKFVTKVTAGGTAALALAACVSVAGADDVYANACC